MILTDIGKVVDEEWLKSEEMRTNIKLDYYVIIPNHFHGIIIIEGPEIARYLETHRDASLRILQNNLSDIIRGFKGSATKKTSKMGYIQFQWQPRFYDHIIRNEADLRRVRNYIKINPLEWELDEYYRN